MIIRRAAKKHKQNRKINRKRPSAGYVLKKILFWMVFISFCAVAVWTVFFSDVMMVDKIEVKSSRAEKQQIEKIVEDNLEGSYWSVFPKRNLLLVSKNAIKREIGQEFVFVREVNVVRSFPKTIAVTVQERESHIVWCSNNSCHLVDERAEAFYELGKNGAGENSLVRVTDESNKEVFLGARVANPSFVEFSEHMPGKVSSVLGAEVSKSLTTPSSMSSEVRTVVAGKWKLLLSTERAIETQAEILKKIIAEKIEPGRIDDLEYIDLRIKGKATFKLKGEAQNEGEDGEELLGPDNADSENQ